MSYMERLQNPNQAGAPSKNLWVGNLPDEVGVPELRQFFAGEGFAIDEVIMYESRRYAYVLFKTLEEAAAAKNALQKAAVRGVPVKIEFDHELTKLRSLNGFKFMPTDRELLTYFLHRKVRGLPIPPPLVNMVPDENLYGDEEPWQIWEKHRGDLQEREDLYFFTELKRKTKDGARINRRVGSGTWKGEDGGRALHFLTESGKEVSGLVKRLRYEDGVREMEGRWIMHEYSIQIKDRKSEMKEYVLCRIRKNEEKEKMMFKRKRVSEIYDENSNDDGNGRWMSMEEIKNQGQKKQELKEVQGTYETPTLLKFL